MRKWIGLVALLLLPAPAAVAQGILYSQHSGIKLIGKEILCFADSSNRLTVADILSGAYDHRFAPLQRSINTFPGLTSTLWMKFQVKNISRNQVYLEIGEVSVNNIGYYKVQGDSVLSSKTFGFFQDHHTREVSTNLYLVDLDLPPGTEGSYLLSVSMRYKETITVPLSLGTMKDFLERNHRHDLLAGIFYGGILMVMIFNLIIYFIIWDRSYLYFCLHTAFAALWVANYYGHAFEFLWSDLPHMNRFTPAITAASGTFVILFSAMFLKIKEYAPRFFYGIPILLAAMILSVVLNALDYYHSSLIVVEISSGLMCVYLLGVALYVNARGYSPARFYVLALFSFFSGVILFLLQINGLVGANFLTRNAVPIGLFLELGLISFALGNRLRFYRQAKKHSQQQLISSFLENEKLLTRQKELLEAKIEQQKTIDTMRIRISQDIHDDVSSGLTKITWLGESLKAKLGGQQVTAAETSLDKILFNTRETISKISEIIWSVNPANDNLSSLLSYMRRYISGYLEDGNIQYRIDFPDLAEDRMVNPDFKRNILLVLKEAIHNSMKYSEARTISVGFEVTGNDYIFTVADDGKGFDMALSDYTGNGLVNMKDRAGRIQADFMIHSAPGEGCRITIKGSFHG